MAEYPPPPPCATTDTRAEALIGMYIFCVFPVQTKGEPASPVHQMVLETNPRNQGPELPSAALMPQMTVVADLTRSERIG